MNKVQEHPNCIIAVTVDKAASLLIPNPELEKWMDGCCFDDHSTTGTPKEPGIYRANIEIWFSQGYSEGHPAPGESDWEFKIINIQSIPIDNPEPLPMIEFPDKEIKDGSQ